MGTDITKWRLPALIGIDQSFKIRLVRELTDEEQKNLKDFTTADSDARNRFKLFIILERNHQQWLNFVQSLRADQEGLIDDEMIELDRLQLNYQTAARSLLDHFRQHWKQTFKNTPSSGRLDALIENLEKNEWSFAFFQDLRNFTQHNGLPVGNYSRSRNSNGVMLQVQADSAWLIERDRRGNSWTRSKLKKQHGKLDLVDLTARYHDCLRKDFGNFVAKAFAPELLPAHNFFARLAQEVTAADPKSTFKILERVSGAGDRLNLTYSMPPTDLLGSLGISVSQN